jgi:DNA-binding CsgD family transcriptional regulator
MSPAGPVVTRTVIDRHELSPREREVLRMLCLGMSNRQIAEQLGVSPETVKTHVSGVLRKLRVESRGQAVARVVDDLASEILT